MFRVGSAGNLPAPPGDPPGGMGATICWNNTLRSRSLTLAVPAGGSPDGTGGSPVLPSPNTSGRAGGSLSGRTWFAAWTCLLLATGLAMIFPPAGLMAAGFMIGLVGLVGLGALRVGQPQGRRAWLFSFTRMDCANSGLQKDWRNGKFRV